MNDEIIQERTNNKSLGKTFFLMFLGILGTAIVAWYTYNSGLLENVVTQGYFGIILIVEIVVALLFGFLFRKLPPAAVGILYFLYSVLSGVTLSTIFIKFKLDSIIYLFGISAAVFALLGLIGYTTKANLSSWRPYIVVFLIAGIILSLINVFILKSSVFSIVLNWFILAVFCRSYNL